MACKIAHNALQTQIALQEAGPWTIALVGLGMETIRIIRRSVLHVRLIGLSPMQGWKCASTARKTQFLPALRRLAVIVPSDMRGISETAVLLAGRINTMMK
jgi:hypothetical protein